MRSALRRHWASAGALMALWATSGILFALCVKRERGHFVYAIDDVYIHMAVAHNFARHGVWGVTSHGFSSSTSSIIWPVLLSLIDRIWEPNEFVPLLLNVLFASLAVLLASSILRRRGLPQSAILAALLGIVFFAPLTAAAFTGMEHCLHTAVTLPFAYLVAEELAKEKSALAGRSPFWLWGLAALLTAVRYEGLFLVFAACLLFLARRRWQDSVGLGLAAIAPVAAYGVVSRWKGWFWVPNSIFLKANLPHAVRAGGTAPVSYGSFAWSFKTAHVLGPSIALIVLLALLLYRERNFWKRSTILVALFLITAALHLKFAALGWFFRYEAYLVALALFVLAAASFDYLSGYQKGAWGRAQTLVVAVWIVYLIGVPFSVLCFRGFEALRRIPQASRNIYEQQYQMGLFLGRYYRGQGVAVNDIGAVSYFGDPRLEDLWGLGSLDVAKERAKGELTAEQISKLTKAARTKIAVVHERRFRVPRGWKLAGQWTIEDNYMCAEPTVSFFAVDPSEERRLIARLREFSASLPSEVVQSAKYTQPGVPPLD